MSDLAGDGALNLPFEEVPDGPIELPADDFVIVTGVTYRAAVVPSPVTGHPMAAVILDLFRPAGDRLPPVLLLFEDDDLLRFPDDLRRAIRSARRHAGR